MNSREHICESFELFANEFMPEFQDVEAEQQEWKTKVLAASRPGLERSTPVPSRAVLARIWAQLEPEKAAAAGDD